MDLPRRAHDFYIAHTSRAATTGNLRERSAQRLRQLSGNAVGTIHGDVE
jgi:hypothetical protein